MVEHLLYTLVFLILKSCQKVYNVLSNNIFWSECMNKPNYERPTDVKSLLAMTKRPKRAVVTAGMPYANGPLHIGHLAGAHVPPDVLARYLRMLIGKENVLFVSGTDDHGSTSEVAAINEGLTIREFIDQTHAKQKQTLDRYGISF